MTTILLFLSLLSPSEPIQTLTPPIIEYWPGEIRPLQGLEAVVLTKLGRLEEALAIHQELARSADTADEAATAWNNSGAVWWNMGNYDAAVRAFNISALANHSYFYAYDALINAVHRRYHYDRSASVTAPAIDLAEETYGVFGPLYTAGKFNLLDGRFERAANYLWRAVPLAQHQSTFAQIASHLNLAEALWAMGRKDDARYHRDQALRRDPTFGPALEALK